MSNKTIKRLFIAAEWALLLAAGFIIGITVSNIIITFAAIVAAAGVILLTFEWLKKTKLSHLFVKPTSEEGDETDPNDLTPMAMKGPWKYILLALHLGAGALFGYSAISLVFELINGGDGYAAYLIMMGVGTVLFAAAIIVQMIRDVNTKKAIIQAERDERINANNHKAGYIAMWGTLAMLMVFGGAAAALPIESANALIMGMLMVCLAGFLLYVVVYTLFAGGTAIAVKPTRFAAVCFALSLVPLGLMWAQWIINGLSAAGIAFFIAFAIISCVLLIEAVAQKRINK
jgi:MFS family permease